MHVVHALTYRDTFVGRLKRPGFDWSDPAADLNRSDIEFLTDNLMDDRFFTSVYVRETSNSRTLDWGSTAVRTTKEEVLTLMGGWRTGYELPGPGDGANKPMQSRARSLEKVRALPEGDMYVLVSDEF